LTNVTFTAFGDFVSFVVDWSPGTTPEFLEVRVVADVELDLSMLPVS
jgi:hypothetical protein